MKKHKSNRVRISGQLDSLTDHLKQILGSNPGQTVEQLVPQAQRRLATRQGVSKVEKNLRRCLQKNPAFSTTKNEEWFLVSTGYPENDGTYKLLKNQSRALTIAQIQEELEAENLANVVLTEKQLVCDGRFIRLKQGKWALVSWEIKRYVNKNEIRKINNLFVKMDKPLTLDYLAQQLFKTSPELTDLAAKMRKEKELLEVDNESWFLASALPDFKVKKTSTNFAIFRQAEAAALQEAELLLILNDSDCNSREYIVSSTDLDRGVIRLSKRMEKMFKELPSLAYITLETDNGEIGCWYSRENAVLAGLQWWYAARDITPGVKLKLQILEQDQFRFRLVDCGRKEAQVFTEGQRLRGLIQIAERHQEHQLSSLQIVSEIMLLFPAGIKEEELGMIAGEVDEVGSVQLELMLASYPFFEKLSNGCWRYNQRMKLAYEQLEQEMLQVRQQMDETRVEIAASTEEARNLLSEKERLEDELYYLENRHREEELLYQERTSQLREENKELLQENAAFKSQLEKLNRRLQQMRHQVAAAEELTEVARQEKEIMDEKITNLENRMVQLQGYLSKTVEEMQHERARLQRQVKELESQYETTVLANEDLHRTIEKLQLERRSLKKKLSSWPVRWAVGLSVFFGGKK